MLVVLIALMCIKSTKFKPLQKEPICATGPYPQGLTRRASPGLTCSHPITVSGDSDTRASDIPRHSQVSHKLGVSAFQLRSSCL